MEGKGGKEGGKNGEGGEIDKEEEWLDRSK